MRNRLHQRFTSMRRMALLIAIPGVAVSTQAIAADITIGSPVNGSSIPSPVLIRAHNVGCDGLTPTSFGYSLDDSGSVVMGETPFDIDVTNDPIPAGTHTVHFKSWNSQGVCPVVSTTFRVTGTSGPYISPNAISSGDLDASDGWFEIHDGGTPGKSKGITKYPASSPLYDDAREFYMTYSDRAGERWATFVGVDRESLYFVLDTYVFLVDPAQVLNLELDINHTMANGETVLLATQCSGVTKSWEYGFTVGKLDHWWSTNLKCDPTTWAPNVWHHVQIGMHHDDNGVVTHDWVTLDGVYTPFENATREAAHFDEWAPGITNTQFQIEGTNSGTGSVTAYIHKLTVYRW